MTDTQIDAVRAALLNPKLHIRAGLGNSPTEACTIAVINFTLTGKLHAGPHPCISDVIRRWVICVQDAMPDEIRNGTVWREAAAGIVGSATGRDADDARSGLLLTWMWEALGDEAVLAVVPASVRPLWDTMLAQRTATAADAAADAAHRVYLSGFFTQDETTALTLSEAAHDAVNATRANGVTISPNAGYTVVTVVTLDALPHATFPYAAFWERRDVPGMLRRLCELR